MRLLDLITPVVLIWGTVTAMAPALQLRQMLTTRSSRDVSLSNLSIVVVNYVVWMTYGAALQNLTIVAVNALAFAIMSATVLVGLSFRRGTSGSPNRGRC